MGTFPPMPMRMRRTRGARLPYGTLVAAATAALLATLVTPAGARPDPTAVPAVAQATAGLPVRESRPVHSYADAIRESVWVDTGLDGDGDGRTDRVAVDIVRPRETAAAGRKIPVIMDASPYYACCGRGNESQKKTYDADGNPVQFPLFYDNFFVPRGYAFVAVDLAGTNRSDGCDDVGGRSDIRSAKAVVDWLNGRARGYTSRTGDARARATTWSTGNVGMIGKSWDGTVANGVAATGVEGLKTIVPIGAISSWYDYFHSQGAPLYNANPSWLSEYVNSPEAQARCGAVQQRITAGTPYSGDRTPAWAERDYVRNAGKVKASVFVVHGQQDLNVRANHFGQWWDALGAQGVERKIDLLEGPVRVDVPGPRGHRPVDQVEVDVIEAQLVERGVEGAQRRVVALVVVPHLRGDEQVLTGDPGRGQGAAGALLVPVGGRRVDRAVAGLEGGRHGRRRLVVRHLPDAEAQLRHPHAVVQGDRGNLAVRAHVGWVLTSSRVLSDCSHRQRSG